MTIWKRYSEAKLWAKFFVGFIVFAVLAAASFPGAFCFAFSVISVACLFAAATTGVG